jgi:hypothetical protein
MGGAVGAVMTEVKRAHRLDAPVTLLVPGLSLCWLSLMTGKN